MPRINWTKKNLTLSERSLTSQLKKLQKNKFFFQDLSQIYIFSRSDSFDSTIARNYQLNLKE